MMIVSRRYPGGVEVLADGSSHARVWAPARRRVDVVIEGGPTHPLAAENGGYFSGIVPGLTHGTRYRFRLDGDSYLYPDPYSRFQPDGPHGPSVVIDPSRFRWSDAGWKGVALP